MAMVGQLQEMGFPADDSQQAVLACGARSIEACIERVMNPDVQTAPPVFAPPVGGGTPPSSCYSDPGTAGVCIKESLAFAHTMAFSAAAHFRGLSRTVLPRLPASPRGPVLSGCQALSILPPALLLWAGSLSLPSRGSRRPPRLPAASLIPEREREGAWPKMTSRLRRTRRMRTRSTPRRHRSARRPHWPPRTTAKDPRSAMSPEIRFRHLLS